MTTSTLDEFDLDIRLEVRGEDSGTTRYPSVYTCQWGCTSMRICDE
jgi:hypothetical protein